MQPNAQNKPKSEVHIKAGKARQASMTRDQRDIFVRSGAKARAEKLTAERRSEIAKSARKARTDNHNIRKQEKQKDVMSTLDKKL